MPEYRHRTLQPFPLPHAHSTLSSSPGFLMENRQCLRPLPTINPYFAPVLPVGLRCPVSVSSFQFWPDLGDYFPKVESIMEALGNFPTQPTEEKFGKAYRTACGLYVHAS